MRRREEWILAALLALLIGLALPVLTFPIGSDQGTFAVIGQAILDGKRPYLDVWDIKTPGIYYVYAATLAVVGPSMGGLHILDLLICAVVGLTLYWLGRRMAGRRVGILACTGFTAYYFTESFWSLAQNDGVALISMSLAVVATIKAGDGGRGARRWAALAGVLAVIIVWFKYPFVLFDGMLVVAYLLRVLSVPTSDRAAQRRNLRSGAAAFVGGAALASVISLGLLAAGGLLDALIENLYIAAAYNASAGEMPNLFNTLFQGEGALSRFRSWKEPLALLLAWGLLRWRVPRVRQTEPGWWLVWLWLLAAIGLLVIQVKGYPYHWLPILPPLILLAADAFDRLALGLWRLLRGWRVLPGVLNRRRWLWAATGLALVFMLAMLWRILWLPNLAYFTGHKSYAEFLHGHGAIGFDPAESVAVADYLQAHASEGETLFIYGFRPEVYMLSKLRPANRFIVNHYLIADWYPQEWRRENVDALWLTMPAYVLVLQGDFTPWATGREADSHMLLQDDVDLNNWLMYNYDRVDEIGAFIIWERKPEARPLG